MGEIQKIGSALTYAKRYSFSLVFGITTADEDTDAHEGNDETPPPTKSVSKPKDKWSWYWPETQKLGLTTDEVHQILGVKSMKDYKGTLEEALAELEPHRKDRGSKSPEELTEPQIRLAISNKGVVIKNILEHQQHPNPDEESIKIMDRAQRAAEIDELKTASIKQLQTMLNWLEKDVEALEGQNEGKDA